MTICAEPGRIQRWVSQHRRVHAQVTYRRQPGGIPAADKRDASVHCERRQAQHVDPLDGLPPHGVEIEQRVDAPRPAKVRPCHGGRWIRQRDALKVIYSDSFHAGNEVVHCKIARSAPGHSLLSLTKSTASILQSENDVLTKKMTNQSEIRRSMERLDKERAMLLRQCGWVARRGLHVEELISKAYGSAALDEAEAFSYGTVSVEPRYRHASPCKSKYRYSTLHSASGSVSQHVDLSSPRARVSYLSSVILYLLGLRRHCHVVATPGHVLNPRHGQRRLRPVLGLGAKETRAQCICRSRMALALG